MDLKNMDYDEKRELAENPSTPEDILRELATDEYQAIRATVAKNPSTPIDVLRDLAQDEHWLVRWNVAENPNVSSKLLVMLFEYEKSLREPHEYVIQALYENKNLPYIVKVIIETLFGEML